MTKPAITGFLASIQNARTRTAYRRDLEVYLDYCSMTQRAPEQMERYHLLAFIDTITARGASVATVRRRIAAIASLHRYLEDEGVAIRTPADEVPRPPPAPQSQQELLGLTEVALLLHAETNPEPLPSLLVLVLVGGRLRLDDALSIRHEHITRDTVRGALLAVGESQLPLPPRMLELFGGGVRAEGPVFLGERGQITRQTARRWVSAAGERASLTQRVTPRILRRSATAVAVEAGVNPAIARARNWQLLPADRHPLTQIVECLWERLCVNDGQPPGRPS